MNVVDMYDRLAKWAAASAEDKYEDGISHYLTAFFICAIDMLEQRLHPEGYRFLKQHEQPRPE